jgi:hypothetical protein
MTINPILAQMDVPQAASMAPRQQQLGRWLREVKSSEDTEASRVPASRQLTWLVERLTVYRTRLTSARRVDRKPLAQQKCSEERNPVRYPGTTRVWDHGRGRSEPCGII